MVGEMAKQVRATSPENVMTLPGAHVTLDDGAFVVLSHRCTTFTWQGGSCVLSGTGNLPSCTKT